ncbi:MAG: RAMP superfamily CRISPR-associated protein [Saprospiraceae bacterium]
MKTLTYSIEFLTFWHTGSGLYGGVDANAAVIRDKEGFPFIPGKTIKGLLREAGMFLSTLPADFPPDFVNRIFGEATDKTGNKNTYGVNSCFFTNAELTAYVKEQLSPQTIENGHTKAQVPNDENLKKKQSMLFEKIASTAIDENGQALDHSLRQMEVTIPLMLYGSITDFPDNEDDLAALKKCLAWMKRLGMNRSRGLGRCVFNIQTD